jgi:hypothetical protein
LFGQASIAQVEAGGFSLFPLGSGGGLALISLSSVASVGVGGELDSALGLGDGSSGGLAFIPCILRGSSSAKNDCHRNLIGNLGGAC